jgi:ribose transport system ATP-binding protein
MPLSEHQDTPTSSASASRVAAGDSQPILQMQGIGKRFPGVVALEDVRLDVYQGEILALIGENGAGKSTLMKILGGVVEPDAGALRIEGRETAIRTVQDATRLGIGFVHQELNVLDNLDIASNVFLGREPLWGGPLKMIDRPLIYSQTDAQLKRLGMNLSSQTSLSKLCLAEQQMVEIAKALSQNARLLIMDEPTSSLTLSETHRLFQVLSELRSQGVSVIYISHRLSEVEEIADRVVVLRDGRNAGELSKAEISHERMVQMMVGRDLNQYYISAGRQAGQTDYFQVCQLRTRKYPNEPISFSIGRGEILGFAGLVGAGRTAVAQAIFGVDRAIGGTILLDNARIVIESPRDAISRGIYLIPEDRRALGLILSSSICDNIALPALSHYSTAGLVKRDSEEKAAAEVCSELNVKVSSIQTEVANLSGGNQQKVVLGKWLTLEPKVLIFDEPTRGVDVGAKAEIYALLRRLAADGVAIMVVSSDMEEVLSVSDRIAVMREGAVTGILERAEFSEQSVMRLAVGAPR